jgi:hypothetical protein
LIKGAHDPNIKYGPEGHVLPGQRLEYRIEFENEGDGIAYGVYFTDVLDTSLDETTLQIEPVWSTVDGSPLAPAGSYHSATRTITWMVGEVDPHEGGYANISIQVNDEVPQNTQIINYGTVYFPSVPEETKTNPIFSMVGVNAPPNAANLPVPADHAIHIPSPVFLAWNCTDDNDDTLLFDVYFGAENALVRVQQDTSGYSYYPAGWIIIQPIRGR